MDRNNSSNSRIFDRSSYSNTTISVYNIISSYFVHIYYNTLYQTAVSLKASNAVPNITLGYRDRIATFVNVIDSKCKKYYKKENYMGILNNLRKEFTTWTNCETLTMTECINKIVKEFVPADFYDSIDKDQRRNILSIIIIGSLRNFNHHITNQYMKMIIDNHYDTDNITALTEKFVDCLIEERQKLYAQFMETESQHSEKVDKKYVDLMRNEISKLNALCKKLENENATLQQTLQSRVEQLTKVLRQARKNEERANLVEAELQALKQKTSQSEVNRGWPQHTAPEIKLSKPAWNVEEQQAREQRDREKAQKEQQAREQQAREQQAREKAEKEQRDREQKAREKAEKEQQAREKAQKEQRDREQREKEQREKEHQEQYNPVENYSLDDEEPDEPVEEVKPKIIKKTKPKIVKKSKFKPKPKVEEPEKLDLDNDLDMPVDAVIDSLLEEHSTDNFKTELGNANNLEEYF
jgi:hypothetical protein